MPTKRQRGKRRAAHHAYHNDLARMVEVALVKAKREASRKHAKLDTEMRRLGYVRDDANVNGWVKVAT